MLSKFAHIASVVALVSMPALATASKPAANEPNVSAPKVQAFYDPDATCDFECNKMRLEKGINPIKLDGREFSMTVMNNPEPVATIAFQSKSDLLLSTICGDFLGKYETRHRRDDGVILDFAWQTSENVQDCKKDNPRDAVAQSVMRTVMSNKYIEVKDFNLQLTSQWGDMATLQLN